MELLLKISKINELEFTNIQPQIVGIERFFTININALHFTSGININLRLQQTLDTSNS